MISTFQTINAGGIYYFESKQGSYIKKSAGGVFMHQFKNNKNIADDVKKQVNQLMRSDEKKRKNDRKHLQLMMESLII